MDYSCTAQPMMQYSACPQAQRCFITALVLTLPSSVEFFMQILFAKRIVKSCTPSSTSIFMKRSMCLSKFVAVVLRLRLFMYFSIYYQFCTLTSKCLGPGCCLGLKFGQEFWLDYSCSLFGISCTYRPLHNKHENVIFANNSFIRNWL